MRSMDIQRSTVGFLNVSMKFWMCKRHIKHLAHRRHSLGRNTGRKCE